MRAKATIVGAAALLGGLAASPAGAQTPGEQAGEAHRVYEFRAAPVLAGPQGPDVAFFDVVSGLGGEVVTGAPYSAEAETEFVQTLADGNRIVRRSSSSVHRDGQGRTRREVPLPLVGPLAAAGEGPRRIVIDDPVADVSWVLDPDSRTARRQPRPRVQWTSAGDATMFVKAPPGVRPPEGVRRVLRHKAESDDPAEREHVQVEADSEHDAGGGTWVPAVSFTPALAGDPAAEGERREESLGIRDLQGVAAEGTRLTVTIPAGRIGNERPLEIVTERWYSEELKTVVQSVRRDPRVGETAFRLRDLRLGEPDPALFEIPSGWTVEEGPGPGPIVIHEERDEPES